ncbi:molybdopterin-dependent oxidoreductase [Haloarculaceae archaeon H-GB11]|nr:molybdopterin-dependent oxidoreductase [Haloarculaceae archaeon H-GB11]
MTTSLSDVPRQHEWTLAVTGAVEKPLELDREDLLEHATAATCDDFDCLERRTASEETYHGVALSSLLDWARPTDDADYALVRAAGGDYAAGFERDRLETYVLAVAVDDADPIPLYDGGPARLFPTDDEGDCWQNVKWVTEVELRVEDPFGEATARS